MRFNFWSWLGLWSNIFTIAVALALLILMAGLGRRHRGNRSFALFLFFLFGWISTGQSTQVLLWLGQGDPELTLHLTAGFFFFQAIALFHFAGRLIYRKQPWFYVSVGVGAAIGLMGLVLLANDQVILNPSLSPNGLLRWDTYPLGYACVGIAFVYLIAAPLILLTHHRQVPHPMIIVGTSVLTVAETAGLTGSLYAIPIPLIALGATAGITILGVSMVHYQLFRPLTEMTRELQARGAELEERNLRLEEANAKLREVDKWKERMTHMVVHDLRSPLNVISVVLNDFGTSLSDQMDNTQFQLLQSALISTYRIQSLVTCILDIGRLENGRLPIKPVPFDITSLVSNCVQAANPLLSLHEITVDLNRSATIPLTYADPTITARVIENLLDNAVKFSPSPGRVRIFVDAGPDQIQFSISDTGPGISPAFHQQIFEKFFQVNSAPKGARSGAGLGLAFCKLALEAQGGHIWVESDGHSGTTFRFTLPAWGEPAQHSNSVSENSEHPV